MLCSEAQSQNLIRNNKINSKSKRNVSFIFSGCYLRKIIFLGGIEYIICFQNRVKLKIAIQETVILPKEIEFK